MKLEIKLPESLYQWLRDTAINEGKDVEECFLELLQKHADWERLQSQNRRDTEKYRAHPPPS